LLSISVIFNFITYYLHNDLPISNSRNAVQEYFHAAILFDPEYTLTDTLEHKMWKAAFYGVIDVLRDYYKMNNRDFAREMFNEYRMMLDHVLIQSPISFSAGKFRIFFQQGIGFYKRFIGELETAYNFQESNHLINIDETLCRYSLVPVAYNTRLSQRVYCTVEF